MQAPNAKQNPYIGVLGAQKLGEIGAASDGRKRANQTPPRIEQRPRADDDCVLRRLRARWANTDDNQARNMGG